MILFLVQIVSHLFPVHLFNLNRFTKISGYNLFFLYVKLNDNSVFYTHTGLIKSDNVKSFCVSSYLPLSVSQPTTAEI